jgi:hypothetical protein
LREIGDQAAGLSRSLEEIIIAGLMGAATIIWMAKLGAAHTHRHPAVRDAGVSGAHYLRAGDFAVAAEAARDDLNSLFLMNGTRLHLGKTRQTLQTVS